VDSETRKDWLAALKGVYGDKGNLNVDAFYLGEWKKFSYALEALAYENEDFSYTQGWRFLSNIGYQSKDYGRLAFQATHKFDLREEMEEEIDQKNMTTEFLLDIRRQRRESELNFGILGGYKNYKNTDKWNNNYATLDGSYSFLWGNGDISTIEITLSEERVNQTNSEEEALLNLKGETRFSYRWLTIGRLNLGGELKFETSRDYNEDVAVSALPNISAFVDFGQNLFLLASLSSGLKLNSFRELYDNKTFALVNPKLETEKTVYSTDLGVQWHYKKAVSLKMNYRHTELENGIFWKNSDVDANYITPINWEDKLRLQYAEIKLSGDLGKFFRYMAHVDLLLDVNQDKLPYFPDIKGDAETEIAISKSSRIITRARYVGKRYVDLGSTEQLKDFIIVGTEFRQRIEKAEIAIILENIANNKYTHYKGWEDKGMKVSLELLWSF
jgi:outer membrane receptor protein involved in Fe transport